VHDLNSDNAFTTVCLSHLLPTYLQKMKMYCMWLYVLLNGLCIQDSVSNLVLQCNSFILLLFYISWWHCGWDSVFM